MFIFDNPEFQRLRRSKLRSKSVILYSTVAAVLFGGALAFMYVIEKDLSSRLGRPFAFAYLFNTYFFSVTGIQLAIVTFYGMMLSAQNVTLEKERGTFDFQRLIAMGPHRLTIGKLFGAPLEALFLALLGVPFAFLALVGGGVSFPVFIQGEAVVFIFAIVVSAFGLMCSSVAEKSAQATGLIVAFGFPFYSMMSALRQSGLWSSASPVFVMTELSRVNNTVGEGTFNFAGSTLPVILGFAVLNGLFIWLCVTITARRIADVELSFLTPRHGLLTFAILQVLLLGECATGSIYRQPETTLQIFHAVNGVALLLMAFALTPGAELVRGRVQRAIRDQHWRVLFERTNRLQDSPGLRPMLEVTAVYVIASFLLLLLIPQIKTSWTPPIRIIPYHQIATLITLMMASMGIAMSALLLYIQVYTERGCFRQGVAMLMAALALPPMILGLVILVYSQTNEEKLFLVSPVAYLIGIKDLAAEHAEYTVPLSCAVIAVALCILAAMRIRFLLDVKALTAQRAERAQSQAV